MSSGSIDETPLERITFTDQGEMLFEFACSDLQGECYSAPMEFVPAVSYLASRMNGAPMTLDLQAADGSEYTNISMNFAGQLSMLEILRCTDAMLAQH